MQLTSASKERISPPIPPKAHYWCPLIKPFPLETELPASLTTMSVPGNGRLIRPQAMPHSNKCCQHRHPLSEHALFTQLSASLTTMSVSGDRRLIRAATALTSISTPVLVSTCVMVTALNLLPSEVRRVNASSICSREGGWPRSLGRTYSGNKGGKRRKEQLRTHSTCQVVLAHLER